MTHPYTIEDALREARTIALAKGIRPHFCWLGPVKYMAWEEWLQSRPMYPQVTHAMVDDLTFCGMKIRLSSQPGIRVGAT